MLIKKTNIFLDSKIFIQILQIHLYVMDEIPKCECPPGSESYEDEDGMMICRSCGGWTQA